LQHFENRETYYTSFWRKNGKRRAKTGLAGSFAPRGRCVLLFRALAIKSSRGCGWLRCPAHHRQVAGDDAPAHPALEAVLAAVQAATQTMRPFENADAAFHARMPLASGDKPFAAFVRFTRLRFVTGL